MPLEVSVWGTPKSSGSFSTLFQTRILRALEYKVKPFELKIANEGVENGKRQKVYGISKPINKRIVYNYPEFLAQESVYLSVGDSSNTDVESESVDMVVTDPPFFDNIHYSQLADFFYVWLRQVLEGNSFLPQPTTRSQYEVQSVSSVEFVDRLTSVFSECHRVLKKNGLMVLTYHHSRAEGWVALYESLRRAGFFVTQTHQIKSEMAVAVPLRQSKLPINFDLIVVCRKAKFKFQPLQHDILFESILDETKNIIKKFQDTRLQVLSGDINVILTGCIFKKLSRLNNLHEELSILHVFEQKKNLLVGKIVNKNT